MGTSVRVAKYIRAPDPRERGNSYRGGSYHRKAFINLAGAPIFKRWTRETKAMIRDSLVLTTKNLVKAMRTCKGKETTLISTSAIGYYGFHDDEEPDESCVPGDDFFCLSIQRLESSGASGKAVRRAGADLPDLFFNFPGSMMPSGIF
jgi:NAD dependent epimerase/dehydratase family enzyme